jgi:pescadillo
MGLQKGSRRAKGKQKLKSVKSKKILGSSRRLSRFGKEQKRGHRGIATHFITRSKAISSLQISINDFRRLCVLKGIYPRDPPGNSSFKSKGGRQRVYYHVKDVSFLAHEPLLEKFRQMKSFMKRFRKKVGKGDTGTAKKMWEDNKPEYNLDHLVRERYPQFGDAIRDLDDALCLIYLFAQLPAKRQIQTETTDACQRLVREWETYVTRSSCLTKVFVSIKGTYYSARVHNEDVTWLVPHKFNIHLPREVDFTLMGWFLDFYQVSMKFVLFRLYNTIGFRYPPILDEDLANQGAHLASITVQLAKDAPKERPAQPEENSDDDEASSNEISKRRKAEANQKMTEHSKSKLKALQKKLTAVTSILDDDDTTSVSSSSSSSSSKSVNDTTSNSGKLFSGLTFFLSREVPRESMELCIIAMGGQIGWDGAGSPVKKESTSITHHIIDRSSLAEGDTKFDTREYIQPQWVYDSINAQLCLPVERYVMGASLPPHLSPFVDDRNEGYIPEYREELDNLKTAAENNGVDEPLDSDSDEEDGTNGHLMENQYATELAAEANGTMYSDFATGSTKRNVSDSEDDSEDDSEEDEDEDEDEEEVKKQERKKMREEKKRKKEEEHLDRQLAVMSKKRKRLYNRMQHGLKAKQDVVDTLQAKRDAAKEKTNDDSKRSNKRKKKSKN